MGNGDYYVIIASSLHPLLCDRACYKWTGRSAAEVHIDNERFTFVGSCCRQNHKFGNFTSFWQTTLKNCSKVHAGCPCFKAPYYECWSKLLFAPSVPIPWEMHMSDHRKGLWLPFLVGIIVHIFTLIVFVVTIICKNLQSTCEESLTDARSECLLQIFPCHVYYCQRHNICWVKHLQNYLYLNYITNLF